MAWGLVSVKSAFHLREKQGGIHGCRIKFSSSERTSWRYLPHIDLDVEVATLLGPDSALCHAHGWLLRWLLAFCCPPTLPLN